jgi:MFS family permease
MLSKPEKTLLWGSNLWMLGAGMFGPLFAVFVEDIGGSILDISWLYATYLIVTGVGIIFVGKFADKVGYAWLMIAGYGLNALATFGYIFVTSATELFIIQVLLGLALALATPTWYALYDKFSGDDKSDGYIWGLSTGMGYAASGIALVAGGFIVERFSFDVLFLIMGTILALAAVYQATVLRFIEPRS